MTGTAFVRAARGAGIWALAGAIVVIAGILLGKPSTRAAQVKSDFGAVARYIFIPSRNDPIVTVVERNSDGVVGTLDAGLVPEQVVVSEATRKLVAVDGINEPCRSSTWRMAIGLRSIWTSRPIG